MHAGYVRSLSKRRSAVLPTIHVASQGGGTLAGRLLGAANIACGKHGRMVSRAEANPVG